MLNSSDSLPVTYFSTDALAAEERFDAWRESISVLFDVTPSAQLTTPSMGASVAATHLGEVLVGNLNFGAQQFSRSQPRIARDGLDHYLVQQYRSGGFVGQLDEGAGDVAVRAGDIVIFDLCRTQQTHASPSEVLTLVLPRDLLEENLRATPQSLHGTVLSSKGGLGGILSDHLESLEKRLPTLTTHHVSPVVRATAQMVAACFEPSLGSLDAEGMSTLHSAPPEAMLECIQLHIGRHLATQLTADSLCQTFAISRATLYRLFKPFEGVSRYVLQRRLRRAYYELASPRNCRLGIGEIAARIGFVSEAHFSRAFRAEFGLRPTDVRHLSHQASNASPSRPSESAEYAQWVRHLKV